jgi:hypothetical protein
MTITTLGVLVFGGLTWGAWRSLRRDRWALVVAGLFGFFLASTLLAPAVTAVVRGVFAWVTTWNF